MAVTAVTFDFWNTLVVEARGVTRTRRIARWAELLAEAGHDHDHDHLDAVFDSTWQLFLDRWHANEVVAAAEVADAALAALGIHPPERLRDELVAATESAAHHDDLELTPNVATVLERFHDAGIKLGIVCDVGLTPSWRLREVLEHKGVLGHFDAWAFSDEVGVYKPDERIFRHVLEGLGWPDPASVAHIGDLRRTDVAGARSLGMVAVRYAGANDDSGDDSGEGSDDSSGGTAQRGQWAPEAHHVIVDHAELPEVLDITG